MLQAYPCKSSRIVFLGSTSIAEPHPQSMLILGIKIAGFQPLPRQWPYIVSKCRDYISIHRLRIVSTLLRYPMLLILDCIQMGSLEWQMVLSSCRSRVLISLQFLHFDHHVPSLRIVISVLRQPIGFQSIA